MGEGFVFHWFGKPIDELKAILETGNITDEQRKEIEKEIARQELTNK